MQLLILAAYFFSCETGDNKLDFDLNNNTSVELISLTLPSQNIFIDSLRTDNESTIVAGRFEDPTYGRIEAEGYTELRYVEGRVLIDSLSFDSLVVRLTINNHVSNDPASEVSLILSDLRAPLESSIVYLKDNQSASGFRIDTLGFEAPENGNTVRVRADNLGRYLFAEMVQEEVNLATYSFESDLTFISASNNQSAVTINLASDSTDLLLYSSFDTILYETRLRFEDLRYSYINTDRTGTEMENIPDRSTFNFSDNRQVISPIFGIYNYVDLSPLQEFIQSYGSVLINRAEISNPYLGTSQTQVSGLRFYFYDETYGFRGEGVFREPFNTAVLSNNSYIERSVNLLVSRYDPEKTVYSEDITFFVENYYNYYLNQDEFQTDGLVITPNSFTSFQQSELTNPFSTEINIYVTAIQ